MRDPFEQQESTLLKLAFQYGKASQDLSNLGEYPEPVQEQKLLKLMDLITLNLQHHAETYAHDYMNAEFTDEWQGSLR